MHDRAGVVLRPQVVDLVEVVLEEVELHPALDVGPVDGDVPVIGQLVSSWALIGQLPVPVRPALLVPEAGGVHQLMHHDPFESFVNKLCFS